MNHFYQHSERRSARRHATPGKLWWLGEQGENFALGFTADTCARGLAFVTAAGHTLQVGETISITTTNPRKYATDCQTLRVRRLEPYGPSLHLIACSRLT